MSRDTPEEVREFAENCGWKITHDETGWDIFSPSGAPRCWNVETWESASQILPDFLNDLNACFEALELFCRKHGMWSKLKTTTGGYYFEIGIFPDAEEYTFDKDSKQSAIICAVNAAAKARPR